MAAECNVLIFQIEFFFVLQFFIFNEINDFLRNDINNEIESTEIGNLFDLRKQEYLMCSRF